jgi:hypothetical protein
MISYERKWIFIHVPRTGGSSLTYTLIDHFEEIGGQPGGGLSQHAKLPEFNVDPAGYFKFSIVRNPWDMCVSWMFYYRKYGPERSLRQAVNIVETALAFGVDLMDHVLRFENLEQDFSLLCDKLEIVRPPLRHLSSSEHEQYRQYYTPDLRDIVAQRFAEDIERFGYEF